MANSSAISLTLKVKGDYSNIKELVSHVGDLQKALRDGLQPAEELKKSLINFNQLAQSFQTASDAVSQLNSMVQDLSAAYAVQEEAETKLDVVMKQRMNATTEEIQAIKDLTAAQQELGVVGDEVQIMGAQQLATFLQSSTALRELIPAMNNLLVQQKGLKATTGDAVGIANLFGKAMQGQASALRRVGITMTEAQEAALKNGNEMERASMLAQIITDNVGEMNAAMAQTDAGRAQQLANTLGDVKEKIGGIVSGIAPYSAFVSQIVSTAANAGRAAAAVSGLWSATMRAGGAFNFLKTSSVASAAGMNAAGTAARFLAAGLRMIMATVAVTAVIMAISVAIDHITSSSKDATDATKELSEAEQSLKAAEEAAAQTRRDVSAQLAIDIEKTKNFNGTKEQEKKLVGELNQRYGDTIKYFGTVSEWYKALTADSAAYSRQMVIEAEMRALANQIVQKEEENRKLGYDDNGKPRKYSTVKDRGDWVTVTNPVPTPYGQPVKVRSKSAKDEAQEKLDQNARDIATLKKRARDIAKEAANIKMPVVGSATPPSGGGTGRGGGSHQQPAPRELNELEKVEEQIKKYQEEVLTADETETAVLRAKILPLLKQREELQKKQRDLVSMEEEYTPPKIDEIKTYDQLDKALSYHRDQLKTVEADKRGEINETIKSLEALRDSWDEALNPKTPEPTELDNYIEQLTEGATAKFASMDSPLKGRGLGELLAGYKQLQRVINGLDGDITEKQRESLKKASEEYANYALKAAHSFTTIETAWSGLKGAGSGIKAITDALSSHQSVWERLTGAVDGAIQTFQSIKSVVELIKQFTTATQLQQQATEAQTVAEQVETAATVTGAAEQVVANKAKAESADEVTNANIKQGASGFFAAHSWIPWVGLGVAVAGIAGMVAMMSNLPKFAEGGIAYGPTVGMFGEYAGASRNPEVVAPLDRLQSIIGTTGGDGEEELVCRVSGDALEFVLNRRKAKRYRS